jgi:uncharacterized protein YmfQ (DUF2313 family)
MAATLWNALDKSATVTLSNGNLTATGGGVGAVRGTQHYRGSKLYFEETMTGPVAAGAGAGIATITTTLDTVWTDSLSAAFVNSNGNIFFNGTAQTATLGQFAAGDVACIALDLYNYQIWFRKNGEFWNGSFTADPAANAEGIDISSVFKWVAPPDVPVPATAGAYPLAVFGAGGPALTVNFGATSPFAHAIPYGFTAWDVAPSPVFPKIETIAETKRDKHVRRSGDDYAHALLTLLPHGQAWPRDPASTMVRVLWGLASYWGFVDSRAADLLERESDPRTTVELLTDWERNWGLPDPCFKETLTIADRQRMLVFKMTLLGGQSRDFFINDVARDMLGVTIQITEYAPFMAGVSQAGDTRALPLNPDPLKGDFRWYIGQPEMRFYWTVHVDSARLTWFRASSGEAGVSPHLRIGLNTDLECLLNRWKPAHTEIVFDYSGLSRGGSMAGTP